MSETFHIPVLYKQTELLLKTQLIKAGYTYKFDVEVEDRHIMFEPDEENNYRAIIDPGQLDDYKDVNPDLLKAIAGTLEELTK